MLALTSDALDVLYLKDSVILPYAGEGGIEALKNQFALTLILSGISGIIGGGLLAIMLKQYTFGVLAGAIWVVSLLSAVGQWLLGGIGIVMSVLLYGTGLEFLSPIIYVGVLVAFFALLAETLSGKPLT